MPVILKGCPRCTGDVGTDREGELSCVQCGWTASLCRTCRRGIQVPVPGGLACSAGCGWSYTFERVRQDPNFRGQREVDVTLAPDLRRTASAKHCPRCDRDLPLPAFALRSRRSDGFASYCKACERAYCRDWRRQQAGGAR